MSDRTIFFSVIVPVFKKERYLERCIKTLEAQSYDNYEVILVDDGSPDRCPTLCDFYSRQYDNITVIHQENSGVSVARNNGASIAKGEYLCFLDADDEWLADFLLHANEIIQETHQLMTYSARYNEYPDGKKTVVRRNENESVFFVIKDLVRNLLYTRTSGFVINKRLFEEVGGFKPGVRRGEDLDLMMRAFCKTKSSVIDNRPNFIYRVAADNNSDRVDVNYETSPTIYYKYDYPVKSSLNIFIGGMSRHYIIKAIKQKRIKLAIKTLIETKWFLYFFYKILNKR